MVMILSTEEEASGAQNVQKVCLISGWLKYLLTIRDILSLFVWVEEHVIFVFQIRVLPVTEAIKYMPYWHYE